MIRLMAHRFKLFDEAPTSHAVRSLLSNIGRLILVSALPLDLNSVESSNRLADCSVAGARPFSDIARRLPPPGDPAHRLT